MLLPVPLLLGLLGLAAANPTVYFKEQFLDGDGWTECWIESKHKPDFGKFVLSSGKFYGDQEKDKGLQTSQDAWFYALSARFEPFSNKGQTLVVQFTVKHEQNMWGRLCEAVSSWFGSDRHARRLRIQHNVW